MDKKIKPPTPIHADAASWSVHIAGLRGKSPGLAARVLLMAGTRMGYHVQARMLPAPTGAGRRAWAQVSFCRPRTDEEAAAIGATIPWGEADLLLSLDRAQGLLSVSPDGSLRVAALANQGVINIGLFETRWTRSSRSRQQWQPLPELHPEDGHRDYGPLPLAFPATLPIWPSWERPQMGRFMTFRSGAIRSSGERMEPSRSLLMEHSKGLRRPGEIKRRDGRAIHEAADLRSGIE